MIETTVAMAVMAGLFIAFGVLRVADRPSCDSDCHGCSGSGACSRDSSCALDDGVDRDVAAHRRDAPRDAGGIW